MENKKNIYLIFSITTTKVGKMIRKVTKYPYNHVSFSFLPDLSVIYSFARHYKDTPLYAGFVREGSKRYCDSSGLAQIMVCAVPVTGEQYDAAVEYIREVSENNKKYLYNLLSAAFVPMHKRIYVDRAYTCIEFAIEMLAHCGIEGAPDPNRFCSIEEMTEKYRKYAIFEGPFTDYRGAVSDCEDYERRNAITYRVRKTVSTNARLFGRFFRCLVKIR